MHSVPQVALIIESSKAFGRGLLQGIGRYTRHHGPWATRIEERSLGDPPPAWLKGWHGDGIIARTRTRRVMRQIAKMGLPMVQLGEEYLDDWPIVRPDERQNAIAAADHLLERQFRHYGFVGLRGTEWSDRRRDVFVERLAEAGATCSVCESNIGRRQTENWDSQRKMLTHWLRSLPKPAGVMACYDVLGCLLLNVCRVAGIAVPEEVAVVGVDNDPVFCEIAHPTLSSVDQGQDRLGYEAAAMLDRIMRGEDAGSPIKLGPVGVVLRQSTDTVAIDDPEVAAALNFIRTHASKGIGVGDVAGKSSVTRRTLERRFQQHLRHTISDEIDRVRLRRVKQLLEETELTIKNIAVATGFNAAPYLSTYFKQATGQVPLEYRAQRRAR